MSNLGGYRRGSGRSKSGYYNGIYCGSTYELCWVIHSIDHGIEFTRFPGSLERNGIKYFPDFLLSDGVTIIEPKGYEKQSSVNKKTAVAESYGYIVNVLRKKDLQYAFDYVKEKYNTKHFYTLYDNYRPKFEYICSFCNKKFTTEKMRKTNTTFCSRLCSGKFGRSPSKETRKKISATIKKNYKKNPQSYSGYKRRYKQIWITDGEITTRIKSTDRIPDGFFRGRSL